MPNQPPPIRNYIARSPLLRKGGVHQRSASGARNQSRRKLSAEVEEWFRDQNAPNPKARVPP